jgi:hypothetical protein
VVPPAAGTQLERTIVQLVTGTWPFHLSHTTAAGSLAPVDTDEKLLVRLLLAHACLKPSSKPPPPDTVFSNKLRVCLPRKVPLQVQGTSSSLLTTTRKCLSVKWPVTSRTLSRNC